MKLRPVVSPSIQPRSSTASGHPSVAEAAGARLPSSESLRGAVTDPVKPKVALRGELAGQPGEAAAHATTASARSVYSVNAAPRAFRVETNEVLGNGVVQRSGRLSAPDLKDKAPYVQLFWQSLTPPPGQPVRGVIVFHHGLKSHSGYYLEYGKELAARGYAVFAHDMRGHGRSVMGTDGKQKPPDARLGSLAQVERDLSTLFDAIDLDHPGLKKVLVGHSVGGLAVGGFAGDYPGVLSGLVPLDAGFLPAGLKTGLLPEEGFSRDPAVVERMKNDPLIHHGSHLGLTLPLLQGEAHVLAHARRVTVPTLAIHGSADQITAPLGSALFMKFKTPAKGDQHHVIEGGVHDPLNDLPEVIAFTKEKMNAFFDALLPMPCVAEG